MGNDPKEYVKLAERLTPQQKRVLTHLGEGKLVKEIADEMDLSANTVANYIKTIYVVMGIHNKVDAARVAWAVQSASKRSAVA